MLKDFKSGKVMTVGAKSLAPPTAKAEAICPLLYLKVGMSNSRVEQLLPAAVTFRLYKPAGSCMKKDQAGVLKPAWSFWVK